CAVAANSAGTAFGDVLSVRLGATPPTVATLPAGGIVGREAGLLGVANPNGAESIGWFRYATTQPAECDDAFGTRFPASGGTALGGEVADMGFDAVLRRLTNGAT